MNKLRQLLEICLLVYSFAWPMAVVAVDDFETVSELPSSTTVEQTPTLTTRTPLCNENELSQDFRGINVQYYLNNEPPIGIAICLDQINSGVFFQEQLSTLETLNKKIISLTGTGKPFEVKTQLFPLLSESIAKRFDTPLTLSINAKTYTDNTDAVRMDIVVPALHLKVKGDEKDSDISIEWEEATGASSLIKSDLWKQIADAEKNNQPFTLKKGQSLLLDIFDTITFSGHFPKLLIESGKDFNFTLNDLVFNSEYDSKLYPKKVDSTVSTIQLSKDLTQINLQDFSSSLKTEIADNGIYLNDATLKFGNLSLNNGFGLKALLLTIEGEAQKEVVNYGIKTQVAQLTLPENSLSTIQEMSYSADFALQNLDAETILKFQDKIYELRRKQLLGEGMSDKMLGMVILGQFMQAIPKIVSRSPEFVLSQINIKTKEGDLRGNVTIGIDGKKPFSISKMEVLLAALVAEGKITVDKNLLAKVLAAQERERLYEELDYMATEEELQKEVDKAVDNRIEQLIEDSWIIEQEEDYVIEGELRDGKLMINGKEKRLNFFD